MSEDPEIAALLKRRAALESELELLRARKPNLPADQYDVDLERLLLEISRISQQLRAR